MRIENSSCPNFLDKKDPAFKQLHGTLDSHFRKLHESGLGRKVKHAELITKEDENKLWATGEMGRDSPRALQNAVFFCNGKNFCLRGGEEHRNLKVSQFERLGDPDRYLYHENCSKNRSGTFRQLHVDSKVVPIYYTCNRETSTLDERCHVHPLDLYISKLPEKTRTEQGLFYLRPLQLKPLDETSPWFCDVAVGKNTLQSKLKTMCAHAGIEGNKTNHSLRATGASELFHANVPEKMIQERTGHRSVVALRTYERTAHDQHQAVSSILSSASPGCSYQSSSVSCSQQSNVDVNCHSSIPAGAGNGIQLNFQSLTGCTINVFQHPPQASQTSESAPPPNN